MLCIDLAYSLLFLATCNICVRRPKSLPRYENHELGERRGKVDRGERQGETPNERMAKLNSATKLAENYGHK